jgi:hypothetical protein
MKAINQIRYVLVLLFWKSAAVQYCPRFFEKIAESYLTIMMHFRLKSDCVGQLYLSRLQMQEEVSLYWAFSLSKTCPNSLNYRICVVLHFN